MPAKKWWVFVKFQRLPLKCVNYLWPQDVHIFHISVNKIRETLISKVYLFMLCCECVSLALQIIFSYTYPQSYRLKRNRSDWEIRTLHHLSFKNCLSRCVVSGKPTTLNSSWFLHHWSWEHTFNSGPDQYINDIKLP